MVIYNKIILDNLFSNNLTFVDLYLQNKVQLSDIDYFVEHWHQGTFKLPLHEYLGMTQEEYSLWVQNPNSLILSLSKRR